MARAVSPAAARYSTSRSAAPGGGVGQLRRGQPGAVGGQLGGLVGQAALRAALGDLLQPAGDALVRQQRRRRQVPGGDLRRRDHAGEPAGDRGAIQRVHAAADRVRVQRVGEAHGQVVRDPDHARLDRAAQGPVEVGHVRRHRDHPDRGRPSHGERPDHRGHVGRQVPDLLGQAVVVGDRGTALPLAHPGPDELQRRGRVAVGHLVRAHQLRPGDGRQRPGQDLAQHVHRQRAELELLRVPPVHHDDLVGRPGGGRDDHPDPLVGEPVEGEPQRVRAAGVEPLLVVHADQHRSLPPTGAAAARGYGAPGRRTGRRRRAPRRPRCRRGRTGRPAPPAGRAAPEPRAPRRPRTRGRPPRPARTARACSCRCRTRRGRRASPDRARPNPGTRRRRPARRHGRSPWRTRPRRPLPDAGCRTSPTGTSRPDPTPELAQPRPKMWGFPARAARPHRAELVLAGRRGRLRRGGRTMSSTLVDRTPAQQATQNTGTPFWTTWWTRSTPTRRRT